MIFSIQFSTYSFCNNKFYVFLIQRRINMKKTKRALSEGQKKWKELDGAAWRLNFRRDLLERFYALRARRTSSTASVSFSSKRSLSTATQGRHS